MWFQGSISEAIAKSKSESKLFLVFIEGEDDVSKTSCKALESVAEVIGQHAVALKLSAGSENAKHFGAIYPILLVPSTFIIKGGVPVDIVAGEVKPDDFASRLKKAVDTPASLPPTAPSAAASSSQPQAATPSASSSGQRRIKKKGVIVLSGDGQLASEMDAAGDDLVVVDFTASWCPPCQMIAPIFEDLSYKYSIGAVFIKVDVDKCRMTAGMYSVRAMPTFIFFRNHQQLAMIQGADASGLENKILELIRIEPQSDAFSGPSSSTTIQDKVSHAQSKIQEVREKKSREEEEKEREREKERREVGKEMAKLKKLREETEMKEAIDERKKDAQLEKEARARVLAQIAADREERKRRFEQQNQPSTDEPVKKKDPPPMPKVDSDSARIQFRFADGHTLTEVFKSRDLFSTAKEFIQKQEPSIKNFSLSLAYPRKIFTSEDLKQTFYDLSLVPACVLLVIPENTSRLATFSSPPSSAVVSDHSFMGYINWLIIVPLWTIWNFIRTFLPSTPPPQPRSSPTDASPSSSSSSSDPQPSTSGTQGAVRNRNVHRLADQKKDDDDDNNTWNGNSTQQM